MQSTDKNLSKKAELQPPNDPRVRYETACFAEVESFILAGNAYNCVKLPDNGKVTIGGFAFNYLVSGIGELGH